jgi:acetyl esterase/lipase
MPKNSDEPNAVNRRALLALGAVALAASPLTAHAQTLSEVIPLWPMLPPGGMDNAPVFKSVESGEPPFPHDRVISGIAKPTLSVFRPATPDRSALLVIPGGGYFYEAIDAEGLAVAARFAASGVTVFVLTYRLPSEGWKAAADVPLQDAQRAMRIIRARDFGIDAAPIGVLGFSAGAHLAALLATRSAAQIYARVDETDALDARPNFAALLYPVITMLPPFVHESSSDNLLGPKASQSLRAAYSVERLVTAETPPMFLCAADDDDFVPLDNTLMMFASLRAAKVPAAMHIFEKGGHGFGLGVPGSPESEWPDLLLRWGEENGFFQKAS